MEEISGARRGRRVLGRAPPPRLGWILGPSGACCLPLQALQRVACIICNRLASSNKTRAAGVCIATARMRLRRHDATPGATLLLLVAACSIVGTPAMCAHPANHQLTQVARPLVKKPSASFSSWRRWR